jgi:hypothetical protein
MDTSFCQAKQGQDAPSIGQEAHHYLDKISKLSECRLGHVLNLHILAIVAKYCNAHGRIVRVSLIVTSS